VVSEHAATADPKARAKSQVCGHRMNGFRAGEST
jgi:hypothetical protein